MHIFTWRLSTHENILHTLSAISVSLVKVNQCLVIWSHRCVLNSMAHKVWPFQTHRWISRAFKLCKLLQQNTWSSVLHSEGERQLCNKRLQWIWKILSIRNEKINDNECRHCYNSGWCAMVTKWCWQQKWNLHSFAQQMGLISLSWLSLSLTCAVKPLYINVNFF